jgi:ATP-dependent RNA helicase MRH4
MLGPDARPTPIQALSIKWLIEASHSEVSASEWKQFLLASETGSGKSLAYLLPLLQRLKLDEESNAQTRSTERSLNPRAIILAPTHELARQLSSFTKVLTRHVKLRTMCASRANSPSTTESDVTAKKLSEQLDAIAGGADLFGELNIGKGDIAVDVLVGTPVKLMEMVRGRGWDRLKGRLEVDEDGNLPKLRRGRDKMPGIGRWKKEPELGLKNVEWVIVDEADVLFGTPLLVLVLMLQILTSLLDPDFQEVTQTLLADISSARGHPIEVKSSDSLLSSTAPNDSSPPRDPLSYPFNLILTSATIPKSLASYLDYHHPDLIRLTSPNVHQLPRNLKTEYVSWTGGNKFADIEHQCRKVWASDDAVWRMVKPDSPTTLSKILIFCNKNTKVVELAGHLEQSGIKCVALTSTSDQRKRGSNKHLEGFLRPVQINPDPARVSSSSLRSSYAKRESKGEVNEAILRDPKLTPHVMITTSLLSRGLDFAPELEHVFIVDEPRNMVDFLHRAGRSGRAGKKGKVVIFTKMKGRGSARSLKVKERVRTVMKK